MQGLLEQRNALLEHTFEMSQAAAAADMQRANSGLESMQSIDDALGNVEQDILDKVANEWAGLDDATIRSLEDAGVLGTSARNDASR